VTLSDQTYGNYLNIDLGWGIGVTFGVYASMNISGAHLNPAVSVALAIFKKFDWRKVPFYIIVQILGAFLASALVFAVYYDALH